MPPISHRALIDATEAPGLTEQFLVPPFSVLDARQGYWQARKRRWLNLGIRSELGRGDVMPSGAGSGVNGTSAWSGERGGTRAADAKSHESTVHPYDGGTTQTPGEAAHRDRIANATPGGSPPEAATLGANGRTVRGDGRGRPLAETFGSGRPGDLARAYKGPVEGGPGGRQKADARAITTGAVDYYRLKEGAKKAPGPSDDPDSGVGSGTSIFDPVLCELAYRWFAPPGGVVLDPFAGGSVRGVVAAACGLRYYGIDLSERQILANREQWAAIGPRLAGRDPAPPRWAIGDSRDILARAPLPQADLIFTCPPYGDLELYSNDPRDLSTYSYEDFMAGIGEICRLTYERLAPDRFAVWVVGDYRDRKTGLYRGFPADLARAASTVGFNLYNDAILITSVGSLPLRVGNQFRAARKLGKGHQNILMFVKGDPRRAAEACGAVDSTGDEALALAGWAQPAEDCQYTSDSVE